MYTACTTPRLFAVLYPSLDTHHTLTLEKANKKLQSTSGFRTDDRDLLRRGMAADLFAFDPERIDLAAPEKVTDLPEGAPRHIQRRRESTT